MGRFVELNHVISDGMVTYPGVPCPSLAPYLTREGSRELYAPGTEFAIEWLTMIGNTGTYLDSPYHRYPDGGDLSSITLEQTVGVPAVVVPVTDRAIGPEQLSTVDVAGAAVLLHTGNDARFGTPEYLPDNHFLTEAGARHLVERGATLVGIDAVNVDDTSAADRPAHTILLGAGIPIVEHLTGLAALPSSGATFTATPLRIASMGTIPVRAFATLSG